MMIRKLTASFGKLENESLRFHEGLNVIYAPNESGKSTWCAFIRAMLYGVDSAERSRSGYLPDKLRYAPWSGAPMEGTMELTADGCDITLTRRSRSKSAPMQDFSAVYTGTADRVEGLNGRNAGEELTGISKDVFRRSAFIEQGTVAVSGSPELERRISAIVSTGDEQISYTEAEAQLRAWQRKRRYNRRGFLPELEGRMDETKKRLDELSEATGEVAGLAFQLEETKNDCHRLEEAVTESRKKQRKQALDSLTAGRAVLKARSEEHDAAMQRLSASREALRRSAFGDREPEELRTEAGEDLKRLADLKAPAAKKVSPWPALLLFVLAVVSAGLYTAFSALYYLIPAVGLSLAALVLLLLYARRRREIDRAKEERQAILQKYAARSPADIRSMLEEQQRLLFDEAEARETELGAREAYEKARERQDELERGALSDLDFSLGGSEAAQLGRRLTEQRAESERLSARLSELRGRLSAMGDPLVLRSELGRMEEEYGLIEQEYEAISLALEVLRKADAEMQSRFSPELGRVAADYMAQITGGRYADVLIKRDFSALTRASGDSVARESEYLSAGTLDLLYLAVRLAVCELALPEGEPCPLILDDALVNLDETRERQALELLAEIAKKRQVILFTCRRAASEA